MARNEKKETVAARFRAYALTFGGAAIIGGMGLGLVHQHNLHHSLAAEDARLGEQIRSMNEKVQHALRIEAGAKSPAQLEARARALGLQLGPIQVTQRLYIVRTPGPLPLPVPAGVPTQVSSVSNGLPVRVPGQEAALPIANTSTLPLARTSRAPVSNPVRTTVRPLASSRP